jgi:hypothetical protein
MKRSRWNLTKTWTDDVIAEELEALGEWLEGEDMLSLDEFAIKRGYSPKQFWILKRRSAEFAELLEIANKRIETLLLSRGMKANTSHMVDKLLDRHHGYSQPMQVVVSNEVKAKAIEAIESGT